MNIILKLLVWIGLTRRYTPGFSGSKERWFVPIHIAPRHCWRHPIVHARFMGLFYVFRNPPNCIKWRKGRLLPRRWGFGIAGLIEFGDRG